MNQPPRTDKQAGKRIVSKGAYATRQASRTLLRVSAVVSFIEVVACVVLSVCLLFAGMGLLGLAGILFLAAMAFRQGRWGLLKLREATRIDPGVPLTRANTADLPAPASLVRASSEPAQEQKTVLLRAVIETQERHEEQLVRASADRTE